MEVRVKECRSAVSPSRLPGLDWSINPYRGCSHSCAYCYAQDVTRFEMARAWGSVVEVKAGIAQCLRKEMEKRAICGTFGIGTVTDPYQPLEKEHELTRGCLALLRRHSKSVSILTKSDLVLRDMDILQAWPGAEVGISIGIPDQDLARIVEPGAPSPERRFRALKVLSEAGVTVYLMAAPIIPGFAGSVESVERLVSAARDSGVRRIMWDKFNSRPIALSRLRRALAEVGTDGSGLSSSEEIARIRSAFRDACRDPGIELTEAF